MAGLDGLETLTRLRELDPNALVIMISGHGTIATAVEATRRGAFDFLEKPLDTDRLLITVRNALAHAELTGENAAAQGSGGQPVRDGRATRPALAGVRELISKVGPTAARVLITGENGTGKELVARALHDASPRRTKAFIELNCAAIPSELIESELFGHMQGSFTGALTDRAGKFEQADGGTLFLDEVGDMSLSAQAKLLRVLQEGVVTRIGGTKAVQRRRPRARGHQQGPARGDPREPVPRGPALPAQRRADRGARRCASGSRTSPLLVAHFADQLAASAGVQLRKFGGGRGARGCSTAWPGNMRELRNAVERLMILSPGKMVTGPDVDRLLPVFDTGAPGEAAAVAPHTFETFKQEAEKNFLLQKLREHDWNVSETARTLQMPRSNLYKKIERYGLRRESA